MYLTRFVTLLLCGLLLIGCDQQSVQGNQASRVERAHLVELHQVTEDVVKLDRIRTGTLRATVKYRLFVQEEGQIAELPWYPGDQVSRGDLLIALDDSLLRSQVARSRAELQRAERDLERVRSLSQRNLISVEELQRRETELEIARAELAILTTRLGYTRMSAPFAGVVTERLSEPGNFAAKNTHLLTLIDPTSLVIDVQLSEQVMTHLQLGDSVTIQLDALGPQDFAGQITRIYPQVDPLTRRGQVEIQPDPIPAGAVPGQLARVSLSARLQERMMIPFSALRYDQGEYVYLMNAQQRIEKRAITTGVRVADRIEVLNGLEADDQIVIRGFMGLTENQVVKPVTPLAERES
ncbi:efflux RND transporter periplasmic adaptor subunit [Nitrincola iocasae]|uniref:efflux RND transporter periplasmic adaptor subunit n=1 Tax=Nitrincola iocasae TaxID=2614693 RepID=UPI001784257A|nr:efflux RND transporter periplasmic adaptor subunit [Nitrincola iocasae]